MSETKSTPLLIHLNNFQEEMLGVEILKSKEGYGYNYADLDAIINVVFPIMKKHRIGYYHNTDYDINIDKNTVRTCLYNLDDVTDRIGSLSSVDRSISLAKMNQLMVEGSAVTYFRRYHLVAMLGLLADEDHDAGGKRTKATPQTSNKVAGRSVESVTPTETDYVAIFKNQVKNKDRVKVEKTFEMYKSQMSQDDIKTITNIIKEAYENN